MDRFILHNFPGDTPTFNEVLQRRLPSVLVDHAKTEDLLSVTVDNEQGAYEAARHLLELGHKRLGVISLELTLDTKGGVIGVERQKQAIYLPTKRCLQGYARAVKEAGLTWQKSVTVYEMADNTLEEGEQAAATLLSQAHTPSAVLAMSDQLALGALRYAKTKGVAVPEVLSVVGYDDATGAAQVTPVLTTVRQPHTEKGRVAAALLIAQLRGEEVSSVKLKTELVVRSSSTKPWR